MYCRVFKCPRQATAGTYLCWDHLYHVDPPPKRSLWARLRRFIRFHLFGLTATVSAAILGFRLLVHALQAFPIVK